jgi:hypothetical protein
MVVLYVEELPWNLPVGNWDKHEESILRIACVLSEIRIQDFTIRNSGRCCLTDLLNAGFVEYIQTLA